MKKLFTILSIIIAANSYAGDSTFIKKSLAIQPVIVNMAGDTAVYMTWKAFDIDRADTAVGMNTYVSLLDRTGKTVATFNCPIPAAVVNKWAFDPKPIDDYILSRNPRLKRK